MAWSRVEVNSPVGNSEVIGKSELPLTTKYSLGHLDITAIPHRPSFSGTPPAVPKLDFGNPAHAPRCSPVSKDSRLVRNPPPPTSFGSAFLRVAPRFGPFVRICWLVL
jgi:hypothetical protein